MRRNGLFWGGILIALGVLLLLQNLRIITIDVWGVFWPLLLIVFGAWTLWGVFAKPGETEQVTVPLEGAGRAKLRLNYGAGRLLINRHYWK